MKRKQILSILIILTLCLIWGNSLLSREVSGWISDSIMEVMNREAEKLGFRSEMFTVMIDQDGDGVVEPTSLLIRKTAHIAEFAVLAALFWLRLEDARRRTQLSLGLGVLCGAIDETLQIFSHRGSMVIDVLIDACGALLGVAAILLLRWILSRKKVKQA